MEQPPVPQRDELYGKLHIPPDSLLVRRKDPSGDAANVIETEGPVTNHMIDAGNPSDSTIAVTIPKCYVPGQPYVSLDDEKGVNEYLKKQL
jgi:hypothetical protein